MKNLIFVFIISFGLVSCKISAPTFKNLGQWNISKISSNQVTITNTAYFHNPNSIEGIKVKGLNVSIQTDGRKLGTLSTNEEGITLPKMADFQIPLSFTVNLSDLLGNLSSIIGAITGQTIDLRCIGNLNVGYMMFGKSVNIDQTIPVSIKNIK